MATVVEVKKKPKRTDLIVATVGRVDQGTIMLICCNTPCKTH